MTDTLLQMTAEIIWQGKEEPLLFLDSLKEAHLYFLEGMKNGLLHSLLKYCDFTITSFSRYNHNIVTTQRHHQFQLLHPFRLLNSISSFLNDVQCLEVEDAKRIYPKEYTTWREDPSNFCVDGVYPLQKLWERAHEAWEEILLTPVGSLYCIIGFFFLQHNTLIQCVVHQGEHFLVVTHKSILRALICTALGLGPERYS